MAIEPTSPSRSPLAAQYGERYYRHYSHAGDAPYRRDEPVWIGFFGAVAQQIAAELKPRSVLDAGCAIGLLVEALRDRGVEAWGLDVSTYAIDQVRLDIREFCRVASVSDELERDYDLITCIEVLEHLPPDEADRAVANFARHTETVLLSSTPDDYREPTHLNVQPTDYWVGLFARHSFYRDLDFDAHFVSPHEMLFRRQLGLPINTLRAYERRLWQSQLEIRELRSSYQSTVEARGRLESDLEQHTVERDLLSGEVSHWEWRTRSADDDTAEWHRRRAEVAQRKRTAGRLLRSWAEAAGQRLPRGLARDSIGLLVRTLRPNPNGGATAGSASHSLPATTVSSGAKRVLFISDGSDVPRHYRCEHQAESLRLCGWSADVINYEDSFGYLTPSLESYDAFVLQWLELRPNLELFMQGARERAKPLLYDTDDLLLDPEIASAGAASDALSDQERQLKKHGMWRKIQALRRCDAVIVSTEAVRPCAEALHGSVYLSANAVSQATRSSADELLKSSATGQKGDVITLGYLSDTSTRDRNFGQIADAIGSALETYPTARLLVVGPLDLPARFGELGHRIEQLNRQPWPHLPRVLSQVAINLAPLESQSPCAEARSCITYLEAGVLGVPTIASPRPDFARVIRDRDNGLLADSAEAWQTALSTLIESPSMRARIGERARQDILRRHTTEVRGYQLQRLLHDLITTTPGSRI